LCNDILRLNTRVPIGITQVYPHIKGTKFCELIATFTGATLLADFTVAEIEGYLWSVASSVSLIFP
jgi:hypothetical protein